jgi:DNA-binding transcriptional LysR family regulator
MLTFRPYLSMNDYTGLAAALLAGAGIGELPPVGQPELVREGRLVEVMPKWRFRTFDLSLVHLGNRHIPRPVRVFREFAAQMAPTFLGFRLSQSLRSVTRNAPSV